MTDKKRLWSQLTNKERLAIVLREAEKSKVPEVCLTEGIKAVIRDWEFHRA